jgi:curved DNA-binding protein CbpA
MNIGKMGNAQSGIDPVHLRIYSNIIQIQDPLKRIQVINTCLTSIEYINSAKRAGIYSYLLSYISTVNSGGKPPLLPGEQTTMPYATGTSGGLAVPRALQPVPVSGGAGIGATHPSLINAPTASSYTQRGGGGGGTGHQIITHTDTTPSWKIITDTPKQKAMTYFASCLEVLGIQEEVALTEEALKAAYKRMALKAHPDKPGGSEEYFEAVTRAYAYLSEILKHMRGGSGRKMDGRVDAPNTVSVSRDAEAEKWKHAEPVRLNAKNLDMNAFNKMFEQTHMPDPDSDGYGDWLKGASGGAGSKGPKFSGEFNRDVFNRMFEEEARKGGKSGGSSMIVHPGEMALTLNPTSGVDLVGERPSSFTAAPNSKMQFTDLMGAYTLDNTVSDKVSNVVVSERNFEDYRASRERAPDPFSQTELHGIREFETRQKRMDDDLGRRRAEMHARNQDYFDRMKRLVITEGVDQNQKKLTY